MRNSFARYVLLMVCAGGAAAQFGGPPQTLINSNDFIDQRRQLTPQQQGHILTDVQNHHRFAAPSNNQFVRQPIPLFNQQNVLPTHQQSVRSQQQLFQQPQLQQSLIFHPQQPIFNTQQILPSVTPGPLLQPTDGRILQHHTQTSFTPKFSGKPQPTVSSFKDVEDFRRPVDGPVPTQQVKEEIDPEKQKQRLKELREKQAIIEKHNRFVEQQYEKALKKAKEDHVDWVKQQQEQRKELYEKVYRRPNAQVLRYSQGLSRFAYPEEVPLFNEAVQKYYELHPTTTTTTTTTTTPAPSTTTTEAVTVDPESFLDSSRSKLFSEIKSASKEKTAASSNTKQFLPTAIPAAERSSQKIKQIQTLDDLNFLKKQYRSQQIGKDDLLAQLRLAIGENPDEEEGKNVSSREISLPNGQRVQLIRTSNPDLIDGERDEITLANGQKVQVIKTTNPALIPGSQESLKKDEKLDEPFIKTEEITLPDGSKAELIKTTDPKLIQDATRIEPGSSLEKLVLSGSTTTTKPPKAIFEELTKNVVPPGANIELLKHDFSNGGLEQIGGIPANLANQKKVTFVLLEEQSDGSFKVQGVKGNSKDKSEVDVDSILKRIKNGEIKLPPPVSRTSKAPTTTTTTTTTTARPSSSTRTYYSSSSTTRRPTSQRPPKAQTASVSIVPNSYAEEEQERDTPLLKTNIGTQFEATTTKKPSTHYTSNYYSSPISSTLQPPTRLPDFTNDYSDDEDQEITRKTKSYNSQRLNLSPTNDLVRQASSATSNNQNLFSSTSTTLSQPQPTSSSSSPSTSVTVQHSFSPTFSTTEVFPETTKEEYIEPTSSPELPDILKKNGLYAMAKFLKQSGLDTILNETGPYTIFAPTDKAFKALLIQLGGPEKADEKFKENPRLLSGLLLHHVVPGAFTIDSLQEEMTGVSLAGTQLRVNQYNMHDVEWNDVKITTINGAKVLDDKKDIEIPQGIAHSVDRVMFPLPVGDIVQTLQSDREKRFTNFLRALFSSGIAETLQGSKTFTLFAPTDKAFAGLSGDALGRLVSERSRARELVRRHLVLGTLYTSGMRYYQIRDSLEPGKEITLSKTLTKIRVNNIPIATPNIPATNGVIHAVDSFL